MLDVHLGSSLQSGFRLNAGRLTLPDFKFELVQAIKSSTKARKKSGQITIR